MPTTLTTTTTCMDSVITRYLMPNRVQESPDSISTSNTASTWPFCMEKVTWECRHRRLMSLELATELNCSQTRQSGWIKNLVWIYSGKYSGALEVINFVYNGVYVSLVRCFSKLPCIWRMIRISPLCLWRTHQFQVIRTSWLVATKTKNKIKTQTTAT